MLGVYIQANITAVELSFIQNKEKDIVISYQAFSTIKINDTTIK